MVQPIPGIYAEPGMRLLSLLVFDPAGETVNIRWHIVLVNLLTKADIARCKILTNSFTIFIT
jgi:hypothetical protein